MNIFIILLGTHSGIRWLIVLTAMICLAFWGYSWLVKKTYPKPARIVASAYSGLLDLQVLLGLTFMLWTGFTGTGFPRFRFEHMTMMILAAVLAHLPSRWIKAGKENAYRNTLFATLLSLVFIYVGVALLPGGWSR